MMLNNGSSNGRMDMEDDTNAYFQSDPYCQDQRRKDPVYASMASHFTPNDQQQQQHQQVQQHQQQQQSQIPHHEWQHRSGVLKRPDLLPKCTLQWI